jgi:hypothetical protein
MADDMALAVPASPPSAMRPHCGAMASIMLAGEEDEGRRAVWPHHKRLPKWFDPSDWACWPVLSYDKREVHIVAVYAARRGALRRLIDRAAKHGLSPVVVEPIGPTMPAIMRKWGWQKSVVGEGWDRREEWRPASAIEARSDATGPGAAEGESATGKAGDAQ